MSRGPGRMQRWLLAELERDARWRIYRDDPDGAPWHRLNSLALRYREQRMVQHLGRRLLWGEGPQDGEFDYAERESMRRAVLQLARAGRLEARTRGVGLEFRLAAAGWQHALLSVEQLPTLTPEEAGRIIAGLAGALP